MPARNLAPLSADASPVLLTPPSPNDLSLTPATALPATGWKVYSIESTGPETLQVRPDQTPIEAAAALQNNDNACHTFLDGDSVFIGRGLGFAGLLEIMDERMKTIAGQDAQNERMSKHMATIDAAISKLKEDNGVFKREINTLKAENEVCRREINTLKVKLQHLMDQHHRAVAAQIPILDASIVKILADKFYTGQRSAVSGPSSASPSAQNEAVPFLKMVTMIEIAVWKSKDGLYQRWRSETKPTYLVDRQLKKFLTEAKAGHAARAQQAHVNLDDRALLGLALEVERAGLDPEEYLRELAGLRVMRSRMVMEILGKEKTTFAIQQLLAVRPISHDETGNVIISPFATVPARQAEIHAPYYYHERVILDSEADVDDDYQFQAVED